MGGNMTILETETKVCKSIILVYKSDDHDMRPCVHVTMCTCDHVYMCLCDHVYMWCHL